MIIDSLNESFSESIDNSDTDPLFLINVSC